MVNEDLNPESDFVKVQQRAVGRRKLLGRLLSLAGLGVVGGLLSQEKTEILPTVRATPVTPALTDGEALQIGGINSGSMPGGTTTLNADVPGGRAFFLSNNTPGLGANSGIEANAEGIANGGEVALRGFSFTQGAVGVKGDVYGSGGISVLGLAGNAAVTPIVAKGASSQSANLQEWQNSSGTALSVVDKNGNFGIGTPTPTVRLDVAGDAHATDFVATSDMRFKEEVTPIDDALDKVLRLQGVYFRWNNRYRSVLKRTNTKARQVGVIAQQVREVLPEVVSEWGESGEGYLGVDCSRLVAVTIEAMKEQQNQIQRLRERISVLEDHLKRFTSS